jgi:hypothetical protein
LLKINLFIYLTTIGGVAILHHRTYYLWPISRKTKPR